MGPLGAERPSFTIREIENGYILFHSWSERFTSKKGEDRTEFHTEEFYFKDLEEVFEKIEDLS